MKLTVPPKIVLSGDKFAAKQLSKKGLHQMGLLEKAMGFQGLKQGRSKFIPYMGAEIICKKFFGQREIEIYVEPPGGEEPKYIHNCICNCNFSLGYIVEVQADNLDGGIIPVYNVMACNNKEDYQYYEDILASDFTLYEVGQQVLMIPYNDHNYLCCSEETEPTGCQPVKSGYAVSSDDWRTTYRIIPWCAQSLPRWINVREVT
jgi:hypothetical protein